MIDRVKSLRGEKKFQVDSVYCANILQGWSFAVADAYERWSDVTDEEVFGIMKKFK